MKRGESFWYVILIVLACVFIVVGGYLIIKFSGTMSGLSKKAILG